MTDKEKFICIISSDLIRKSDAIVILEGDGFARIAEGARLFKEGFAPVVVISGGINNPPHSIPASEMLPHLLNAGVPKEDIILEEKSMHTRDQAVNIMAMAKERGWRSIIIVASHYHEYRAYLTFLKAMQEAEMKIRIINAPARDLLWFDETDPQGMRVDLLEGEFKRIEEYTLKGYIASYADALEYQKWKEKNI